MNARPPAIPLIATLLIGGSPAAAGQRPPAARADVAGTLGWISAAGEWNRSTPGRHRWHTVTTGLEGGWYWTDHLKTEIDLGADGRITAYHSEPIEIDGRAVYETGTSTLASRRVAISQFWQFRRNTWFHPYAGAGAAITETRRTDRFDPIVDFRDGPPGGRIIRPARTEGPRTEWWIAPIVGGGFKAYMTPRAFFRSDLRVSVRRGIDDVVARVGFGVDF